MDKQIGYPDYLASDNTTKLETDFAEVKGFETITSRRSTFAVPCSTFSVRRTLAMFWNC